MVFGSLWELLALWFIASIVISFLGGYRVIIAAHVAIAIMIIIGFFMGIGIYILNLLI